MLNTFTESQHILFKAYLCLFSTIMIFDNDDILKESHSLEEKKHNYCIIYQLFYAQK